MRLSEWWLRTTGLENIAFLLEEHFEYIQSLHKLSNTSPTCVRILQLNNFSNTESSFRLPTARDTSFNQY